MLAVTRFLPLFLIVTLIAGHGVAYAQDDDALPDLQFTAIEENPVLSRGDDDAWDPACGTIFAPQVAESDGRYYMFYTGCPRRTGTPGAIGYAVSDDGVNWTKPDNNPIIVPDGSGYDAMCVSVAVPLVDDATWVLYFASNSQPCAGPGRYIGRATAGTPEEEWVRDDAPVLEAGEHGAWDAGFIMPHSVVRTDGGYVMYYSAGEEYLVPLPRLIGMATSPDGIHWTKYNDPTTDGAYAASDPIVRVEADGTQTHLAVWALDVMTSETGYEMFFSATCPDDIVQDCPGFIAYARSDDGIHWTAYPEIERRALAPEWVDQPWASHCVCYPSVLRQDGEYWLYFTGCADGMNDCEVGMARGTVTWNE